MSVTCDFFVYNPSYAALQKIPCGSDAPQDADARAATSADLRNFARKSGYIDRYGAHLAECRMAVKQDPNTNSSSMNAVSRTLEPIYFQYC